METGKVLTGNQGRYLIDHRLRTSTQLITAQGQDTDSGQAVVVKELRMDKLLSWKVLDLFERETQVLKQIDHPCLPRYLDTFQVDTEQQTLLYLVCSWAEGESLEDKLEAGWQATEAEVWEIARQVLTLLDYLHSFNPPIIHRDLKPGNLVMKPDGEIQLIDLGSVQGVLNPDGGSTVVGTFGYMPPEQFSDQSVPATDLYALGATLVQLLSGKHPSDLPRKGMKLIYQDQLQISPFYLHWLDQLLAPEVEKRFQSAQQALAALNENLSLQLSPGQSRITSLARGTQLTLQIKPAGLSCLGFPLIRSLTLMAWGLINNEFYFYALEQNLLPGDPSTGYMLSHPLSQIVFAHLFNTLLILGGAASFFIAVLAAQVQTVIQLQPDRYQIHRRLWKFSQHYDGSTSELSRMERSLRLWSGLNGTRLVERSELKLPAIPQLSPSENRVVAGYIGQYLAGQNPLQSQTFLRQTLNTPPGFVQNTQISLQMIKEWFQDDDLWFEKKWKETTFKLSKSGSPETEGPLDPSPRILVKQTPDSSVIEIGTGWPLKIWSTAMSLFSLTIYFPQLSAILSLIQQNVGSADNLPNLFILFNFEFAMTVFYMGGIWLCYQLAKYAYSSRIQTRLTLQADRYQIEHQSWGRTQVQSGKWMDLRDFSLQKGFDSHQDDLIFSLADGQQQTVAYGLNPADRKTLQRHLNSFLQAKYPLFSALQQAETEGYPPQPEVNKQPVTQLQRRLQIHPKGEGLLIKIPPYGLQLSLEAQFLKGIFFGVPALFIPACFYLGMIPQWMWEQLDYKFFGLGLAIDAAICIPALMAIQKSLFLSQIKTTLEIGPQQLNFQHQWGPLTFNRQIQTSQVIQSELTQNEKGVWKWVLSTQDQKQKKHHTLGFYVQSQDIVLISRELEEILSLPPQLQPKAKQPPTRTTLFNHSLKVNLPGFMSKVKPRQKQIADPSPVVKPGPDQPDSTQ